MDSTKKIVNPSPEEKTNCFTQLFYCWLLPFLKYGYKHDVKPKDLYNVTKPDYSGSLGDQLEKNWLEEIKRTKGKKQPSLQRAIFKTFYKSHCLYGIFLFLQSAILKSIEPIVLAAYIHYYDQSPGQMNPETGWLLASAVVAITFANVIISHRCSLGFQRIGMRVRIACCSLMYRKLLRLNQASLGQTAVGQLVNLLSNDVQRFDLASLYLHYSWIMPIQLIFGIYIMWNTVGIAAFAGIAVLMIQAFPLQIYLSKLQGKLRYKIALRTDQRVKVMSEITSGIQVIKMYAWEIPFEKIVALARKFEIDVIRKTNYIKGVFMVAMVVFSERLTVYLTIVTYILLGGTIAGDVVFPIAQLFNTLQAYMLYFFPLALTTYAEARISVQRIEKFLSLEEKPKEELCDMELKTSNIGEIDIINAHASWLPNPTVDTLIDIKLHIKPGTLCCVIGNVGAGKSSLLQLILKELTVNSGTLKVTGSISYASQEPWLFVSSVRNNILFGKPYLQERYHDVVTVCALQKDFEQFSYKDKTLVEERGVSLSGGQRARINLARAVYAESDIYLFDDPLSAVDTHVGKHLFEKCIKEYLHDKTRILVTHQLQFIKQADLIVILNKGAIEKIGTPSELSDSELSSLNKDHQNEEKEETQTATETKEEMKTRPSIRNSVINEEDLQKTDESVEKGSIPISIYWKYLKAGGGIPILFLLVVMLILAQISANSCDMWLTNWTNSKTSAISLNETIAPLIPSYNISKTQFTNLNGTVEKGIFVLAFFLFDGNNESEETYYIYVYTGFIIACILLTISRSILYFKICSTASKVLHSQMFSNILQAPMRFFDENPSGRILNRFSKDMGNIDELLPRAGIDAIQIFLVMIGILAMNFIIAPWMIFPVLLLGVLFYYIRIIYLSTAQDVKRLEGVVRAPVFSYVSASLYGMPTIRASNAENMVKKEFDILQDQHTSSWFLLIASSETFGFYLDVISTIFLAFVTYQFLIIGNGSTLSGNVGLVISQSLILINMLHYGVRQTAELASNMISVERVLQYTKLDNEGPFETLPPNKPSKDWPNSGRIAFSNLYLRYIPDSPPVLKNLNFEIESGEKVGIVGRTGAGKSTIIASIFRLAQTEGTITIDGVDTSKIGLGDLRSNISIIPQEPVLFSASVGYNLDPFEKHSDDVLCKALENVELKGAIEDLSQQVSEGGSNFSAGQRQLICLARAIVRNNKILIMDEATANVDPNTDALIQKTVRQSFKDCTVLTIAHRLNTIMDSDKVLVMDRGQAVEFDHPHQLLQNPSGHFSLMVKETGDEVEQKLRRMAEEAYHKNY